MIGHTAAEIAPRAMRSAWMDENTRGLDLAAEGAWADAADAFDNASHAVAGHTDVASHEATALVLNNLAQACFRAGRVEDGLRHAQRACALRAALAGDDAIVVARARADLAVMLGAAGRYQEARALIARAVASVERLGGDEDARLLPVLDTAARLALSAGDPSGAEPFLLRLHALLAVHELPTQPADALLSRVAQARSSMSPRRHEVLVAIVAPGDMLEQSPEQSIEQSIEQSPEQSPEQSIELSIEQSIEASSETSYEPLHELQHEEHLAVDVSASTAEEVVSTDAVVEMPRIDDVDEFARMDDPPLVEPVMLERNESMWDVVVADASPIIESLDDMWSGAMPAPVHSETPALEIIETPALEIVDTPTLEFIAPPALEPLDMPALELMDAPAHAESPALEFIETPALEIAEPAAVDPMEMIAFDMVEPASVAPAPVAPAPVAPVPVAPVPAHAAAMIATHAPTDAMVGFALIDDAFELTDDPRAPDRDDIFGGAALELVDPPSMGRSAPAPSNAGTVSRPVASPPNNGLGFTVEYGTTSLDGRDVVDAIVPPPLSTHVPTPYQAMDLRLVQASAAPAPTAPVSPSASTREAVSSPAHVTASAVADTAGHAAPTSAASSVPTGRQEPTPPTDPKAAATPKRPSGLAKVAGWFASRNGG